MERILMVISLIGLLAEKLRTQPNEGQHHDFKGEGMKHIIKDIDPDGVLPKPLGRDTPSGKYRFFGTNSQIIHETAHNDVVDEVKNLAVEVDVEELAKWFYNDMKSFIDKIATYPLESIPKWEDANDEWRKPHYEKAQAIASNPKCFKLVKEIK